MSERQRELIAGINEILYRLSENEVSIANSFFENMVNMKLLALVSDAILENMDLTEKLMLIEYASKSQVEKGELDEAISFEECLEEARLKIDDLQD